MYSIRADVYVDVPVSLGGWPVCEGYPPIIISGPDMVGHMGMAGSPGKDSWSPPG